MKKIITILSANYSGSHFLSLLLGSHSHMVHVGEVKHLRKAAMSPKRRVCVLCDPPSNCPLYRNVTPQNIDRVYEIIFKNLGNLYPGVSTLVDTSKKVSWAERFVENSSFEHQYVHLLRDPRALVRRWMLTYTSPKDRWHVRWKTFRDLVQDRPKTLFESRALLYLYKWLVENREITNFLRTNQLDHTLITYQDLALNTESELQRLMEWLRVKFEPTQLQYWNFEHHGTQKQNYEWIKRENRVGYFDARWKEFLTESQITRIWENQDLADYLSEVNLKLNERGLTRPKSESLDLTATIDIPAALPEAA